MSHSCPECLDSVDLDHADTVIWSDEQSTFVPPTAGATGERSRYEARHAYVRCRFGHAFPRSLFAWGKPFTVGMVGRTTSGKSHLVAAMIKALSGGSELWRLGIRVSFIDMLKHKQVVDGQVATLFSARRQLARTMSNINAYVDAFHIQVGDLARTVVLYDVAGADYTRGSTDKQYLNLVDGLVFMVDPTDLGQPSDIDQGEPAFERVVNVLEQSGLGDQVAVSVVLSKADLLRFEHGVDHWYRREVSLDLATIAAEAEDLFAFLHSRGAHAWLRPVTASRRASLHAVSATGGASDDDSGTFVRGVRPRRVLAPLLSLLALSHAETPTTALPS